MWRARTCAWLLVLLTLAPVLGQGAGPVAELSVTAFGAQRLDLSTGMTVLSDGGEVIDQASGTRLTASWIAYAEGQALEAMEAQLEGEFGELWALELNIDLALGRVEAHGGVELRRSGLIVGAEAMGFDPDEGLAWLQGEVAASLPTAAAAEAWIDVVDGRILLLGPYVYDDGAFVLRGGEGSMLQLDPIELLGEASFDASTEVDEDLWARVQAARERLLQPDPGTG